MAVYVHGEKVGEAEGLKRAAEILGKAKLPVIAGLMTDVAGAKQALALAERLGGVIDHAAGDGISRAARLMREAGGTPASLGELRNRADLVIVLGEGPLKANPSLLETIFPAEEQLPRPGENPRSLAVLGKKPKRPPATVDTVVIDPKDDLTGAIGLLAAALRKRPVTGSDKGMARKVADLAERLGEAAFPVFIYSPAELNEPVLHVVLDTVRSICDRTRCATYTVPAPGNGDGVNLCSVWTCGLPLRTSFAHGEPRHDPWAYDAARLIASGEGDALVWIDALGVGAEPPQGVPTILLAGDGKGRAARRGADIVLEVSVPGEHHDAALYLPELSGIGMVRAQGASDLPSVATVLDGIAATLDGREAS